MKTIRTAFLAIVLALIGGCSEDSPPEAKYEPPIIMSIEPDSGAPGSMVTIVGEHFGVEQRSSNVIFDDDTALNIAAWSDKEISVIVPEGASSGAVVVIVDGLMSNPKHFEVVYQPNIRVRPPGKLSAYSGDGEVGLLWTPSPDEGHSEFDGYYIKVVHVGTSDTLHYISPSGNGTIITNLLNGRRYAFIVFGKSKDGSLSESFSSIVWAPAVRLIQDSYGNVIRVYATTSSFPCGLDIYNNIGKAEAISLGSSDFRTRADLYVFAAEAASSTIEIRSPSLASNNPGLETRFSTVEAHSINLNGYASTAPPFLQTYTRESISISTGAVSEGSVYFGCLIRGNDKYYFRMLVRQVNGTLVQGTGNDRYVELEFSYQTVPDVLYAKSAR